MNDKGQESQRSGRLLERDRAFLRDIEQTNWLNHYVVAAGLNRAGAERLEDDHEHTVAGSIVKWNNHDTNPTFFDRQKIEVSTTLLAQVQAIAMLRIFQERTAAMETLGALLSAMKRGAEGGIALQYFAHDPRHITVVYREVLDTLGTPLRARLGWPSPEMVHARAGERASGIQAAHEWMTARIEEVAQGYLRPDGITVVRLGEGAETPEDDPRRSVYVILGPEEWESKRRIDDGIMTRAYGALKHGFNATGLFSQYAEASREGRTLLALQVPKTPETPQRFAREINLVGKLCQEIARWSLEFDSWDAAEPADDTAPSAGPVARDVG